MPITVITSLEQFNEIIKGDNVLIDFWAPWCGPCRAISPVFEKLSESAPPHVVFCKVDIDEVPTVAEEVGIRAIPTFMYYKEGNKVNEVAGANPEALTALVSNAGSA